MELYDSRASAYQWDTGLQIKIDDGTAGEEIHIGNVHSGRACIVNAKASGNDIVADIPDELLQNSKGIAAYRMVTDVGGKYTRQEIIIPVIPRGKPDDYVYTPNEKLKWELLDERITELEKNGTGGTTDHAKLTNRDAVGQHPIRAIEGLQAALDDKQDQGDYLTEETDPTVPEWAKQPDKPTYTAAEVGAVAAEDGKGLSTNDYTNAEKNKLDAMPETVLVTFDGTGLGATASLTNIQIMQAVSAGKLVYAYLGATLYTLVSVNGMMANFMALINSNMTAQLVLQQGKIANKNTFTLEQRANMTNELSQSSTDSQYPSAKTVWDALPALNITGAAVGQLAKISAVDETGKPTAWTPVDMPSGGSSETWELIQDVTLDSDAAGGITISLPTGYKAYHLSIVSLAPPSSSNSVVYFKAAPSGQLSFWDYYPGVDTQVLDMNIRKVASANGNEYFEISAFDKNGDDINAIISKPNGAKVSGWISKNTDGNSITGITSVKYTRNCVAGSNYRLWGVAE